LSWIERDDEENTLRVAGDFQLPARPILICAFVLDLMNSLECLGFRYLLARDFDPGVIGN
jgi:hypothetical protein